MKKKQGQEENSAKGRKVEKADNSRGRKVIGGGGGKRGIRGWREGRCGERDDGEAEGEGEARQRKQGVMDRRLRVEGGTVERMKGRKRLGKGREGMLVRSECAYGGREKEEGR